MLEPTVPGWKVRVVGTSHKTNPMAMESFQKNSIFTNVAETADGEYFWEGLEKELREKKGYTEDQLHQLEITNWLGNRWHIGDEGKAAHPNSRFTARASQCPIIHPNWEAPDGVPIDAIIFGGRRPEGVPLVFESLSWQHEVLVSALVKSEATAAAEHTGKHVMHDSMAMRPFTGYNFGKYLQHWARNPTRYRKTPYTAPKVFHVNWFRETKDHKFLWPGFGDNIRVLEWVLRRVVGKEDIAVETPIGYVPKKGSLNLSDLPRIDWNELMSIPKQYWEEEHIDESKHFLESQVGPDMPATVNAELEALEKRIHAM